MPSGATDREAALAWAAECRGRRAELERSLAEGGTSLADALGADVSADHQLGLVKLLVVLEALPGARKVKTRQRLVELGIDGARSVRDLTTEERATVLSHFPLEAPEGSAAGAGGMAPDAPRGAA